MAVPVSGVALGATSAGQPGNDTPASSVSSGVVAEELEDQRGLPHPTRCCQEMLLSVSVRILSVLYMILTRWCARSLFFILKSKAVAYVLFHCSGVQQLSKYCW